MDSHLSGWVDLMMLHLVLVPALVLYEDGCLKDYSIYDVTDGFNLIGSIDTFLASIEGHPKSNHIKFLRENIELMK